MSILSRILAFLNVVAAIVMLYLLAQVYPARISWQQALRSLEAQRDGVSTAELYAKMGKDYAAQMEELKRNPPQSEEALRLALLQILFPPENPELLADADKTNAIKQRYGLSYDDVRRLVEERIGRVRTELAIEEQTLLNRRRELEIRRRRLEEDIRQANERLTALQKQVDTELAQHDNVKALIHARRLEIVFWYARLNEAFASLQLTNARYEDMVAERRHFEETRDKLLQQCQELEQRITDMEKQLARVP
ncbi:hypothetical protein HRbin36_02431 [bacterium HR36]|nr:hypothetical protein HRbin36_02431 [bacterium HR36]